MNPLHPIDLFFLLILLGIGWIIGGPRAALAVGVAVLIVELYHRPPR